MHPDAAKVQSLYRARFDERAVEVKNRVWKVLVEAFFQKWIGPEDRVLELGCGHGEFLNHVRCARRIGVDLNPDSAGRLDKGIEFHAADVRSLPMIPDGGVDVVFTSNLLEHLESKGEVERLIREARRVLRPGGHLILLGPNYRFLPGEYWDFWDHHTPLTDQSLAEILELIGYRVVWRAAKFLPYTTRGALPKAAWMVRAYLAFPPAWRLLGKQFLLRAMRP